MQNIVLKIVILLFILNVSLLGSAVSEVATTGAETVEVSLESFTTLGIFVMIGLSSLLGAFFLKYEFSSLLD